MGSQPGEQSLVEPNDEDVLNHPALREIAYDSYLHLAFSSKVIIGVGSGRVCEQSHWAMLYLVALNQEGLLVELMGRAKTPEARIQAVLGLRALNRISKEAKYLAQLSTPLTIRSDCDCARTQVKINGYQLNDYL